jgi:GT2 family glycosyltransferase
MSGLSVGVIIPTFNRESILTRTLATWDRSRRIPDQFLVVDASPNAEEARRRVLAAWPRVFAAEGSDYLVTPRPGTTCQRNLGIDRLRTDLAILNDDDTLVSPDYVEKIVDTYEKDSEGVVGGVRGYDTARDGRPSEWVRQRLKRCFGPGFGRLYVPHGQSYGDGRRLPPTIRRLPVKKVRILWGAMMSYRTEALRSVGGFDEALKRYALYEDADISFRIGKTHFLVKRLDARAEHREEAGKQTRPSRARYFLVSWVNAMYLVQKNFGDDTSRRRLRRLWRLMGKADAVLPPRLLRRIRPERGSPQLYRIAGLMMDAVAAAPTEAARLELFSRLQQWIFAGETDLEDEASLRPLLPSQATDSR